MRPRAAVAQAGEAAEAGAVLHGGQPKAVPAVTPCGQHREAAAEAAAETPCSGARPMAATVAGPLEWRWRMAAAAVAAVVVEARTAPRRSPSGPVRCCSSCTRAPRRWPPMKAACRCHSRPMEAWEAACSSSGAGCLLLGSVWGLLEEEEQAEALSAWGGTRWHRRDAAWAPRASPQSAVTAVATHLSGIQPSAAALEPRVVAVAAAGACPRLRPSR